MARGFVFTRWIGIGLLAELIVFVAVADRAGFGWAVVMSLASSLFGLAMLRRSGLSAVATLRTLNERTLREGMLVDGMLGALGAVLLILPGFLTDIAGLVLLAPSVRQSVARRFGLSVDIPLARPPRRPGDRTIDLPQGDWTRLDNPRKP